MLHSVNTFLVFFNLEEFFSISLSFMIFLMNTGQLFCGMSLNLGLSDVVEFPFSFMRCLLKYKCPVGMWLAAGNSFSSPAVLSFANSPLPCLGGFPPYLPQIWFLTLQGLWENQIFCSLEVGFILLPTCIVLDWQIDPSIISQLNARRLK